MQILKIESFLTFLKTFLTPLQTHFLIANDTLAISSFENGDFLFSLSLKKIIFRARFMLVKIFAEF
jgi:hypothetical protein